MKKLAIIVIVACNIINCSSAYNAKQYPLHAAVDEGNAQKVQNALKSGTPIDMRDDAGATPLMVAVYNGKWDMAKTLAEMGADINVQDSGGYTPLHYAVFGNRKDMVTYFIGLGATIDARDNAGITPLLVAASYGYWEIVKGLSEEGANINIEGSNNMTPLLYAVSSCQPEMVSFLVSRGANTKARSADGLTPMHYVVYSCSDSPDKALAITNDLIDQGCDISAVDNEGHSAYWAAMYTMCLDMVTLLRQKGVTEQFDGKNDEDYGEDSRVTKFYTPPSGTYIIPEGQEILYQRAIEDCNFLVVPFKKAHLLIFGPIVYGANTASARDGVATKHNACMEKMGFRRIIP